MKKLYIEPVTSAHSSLMRLLCIFVLAASSTALAQDNRVTNPSFTDGFNGWDNEFDNLGGWDSRDAGGDPLSGSALFGNDKVGSGATPISVSQCIDLTAQGGKTYEYGAQVLIESGGVEGGSAVFGAWTYPTSNCMGDPNVRRDLSTEHINNFEFDRWTLMHDTVDVDAFDNSIQFFMGTQKPEGVEGQFNAFLDNAYVREEGFGHRLIDESLAGIWYNVGTPGQGLVADISNQINLFFAGWYTWTTVPGEYDWMTLQGGFRADKAELTIFRTSGGVFNDPTPVTTESIGSAEFLFNNCTEAELHILFDGEQQVTQIDLTRLGPAPLNCVD